MIDLQTIIDEINTGKIEFDYKDDDCCTTEGEVVILLKRLAELEKADYVEVVCCEKCKHGERYVIDNDTFLYKCRKIGISGFTEDFYCSYGERSEL